MAVDTPNPIALTLRDTLKNFGGSNRKGYQLCLIFGSNTASALEIETYLDKGTAQKYLIN